MNKVNNIIGKSPIVTSSQEKHKKRDWLDIIEVFSKIIASIAIPIILVVYGNNINTTMREKEISLKYVEVAVGILKSKPNSETMALRKWAIAIIQKNSTIPLSQGAINELENSPLPKVGFLTDEKGNYITDEKGNRIILE